MEKRSLIAYEHYREASQKFEYFITALIGALCAYIANSFLPVKLGINSGTLELLALISLALSFYISVLRLQGIIIITRVSANRLHLLEKRGMLVVNSNEPIIVNQETGDILDSFDIVDEIKNLDKTIPGLEKIAKDKNKKVNSYYKHRFCFLYIGFILLIASKIWSAYS